MRKKKISQALIDETIQFHGHSCPGLAIGIRASEVALQEFEKAPDEEVVAVVETDMCAVDAVQYLTGCTFGKGNLIHLDYGKTAFSFYRRADEKGIRAVMRPETPEEADHDMAALQKKMMSGEILTDEEEAIWTRARASRIERIMSAKLEDLFEVQIAEGPIPKKARILESLICEACGEKVMETRTRRFQGRTLCLPCFEAEEKRL